MFSLYQPKPSHPDWAPMFAEARTLASSLLPKLEPPQSRAHVARRRARAYATAARNYLDNRKKAAAGREDLWPLYFIWTTLRTCNFDCSYCDDHRGSKYPDLPNKDVLSTEQGLKLLRVMRTRCPSVYFAGGEPTLRKDLPKLTTEARDLGYYPIIVNTNGSIISKLLDKAAWRSWVGATDIIIVSLDSLDLPKLATMWGSRTPQDVIGNLLLLRELAEPMGVKLMVNCVIQPDTVDQARDVLNFVNDLGIWFCPVPVNRGPEIDGQLESLPSYRALGELILERKRSGYPISGSERLNRRLLRSEPKECRNTLKPHVDFDGRLFWPCKASVNVEPERINVLDFEDVDSLYAHGATRVDPTRFCGPAKNQCGASCNWAQNYSTDSYAYGLHHPGQLVREALQFARPGA